jgi:ATP-dependent exoDNAse (exonuclease V) alpha subunit
MKTTMADATPTLSSDQIAAAKTILDSVEHNQKKWLYLGGEPGCGKSFLINAIIKAVGRQYCAVMSPTAIAAQLIGGSTVHSFFGFHYKNLFDDKGHLIFNCDRVARNLMNTKLVICDEVSMLSSGYFELVMYILAEYDVTILFVGDFMQLQPVPDRYKSEKFSEPAYTHERWPEVEPLMLKTNFRQSEDPEFLRALADMRVGRYTPVVHQLIEDRTTTAHPSFATKVFALVRDVEAENRRRLTELGTKVYASEARIVRAMPPDDIALKMLEKVRIPRVIHVSEGSRVVMLTNDENRRWYNGSTGEVVKIEENNKTLHLTIQLDNNNVIKTNSLETHQISDANGAAVVMYRQLPLMLAFAMTVHRIQGQTMRYISVDLNNHFARGMTYVAISRCMNRPGLFLSGRMGEILYDAKAAALYDDVPAADKIQKPPAPPQPGEPGYDLEF